MEECLAKEKSPGRLRRDFMFYHWKLKGAILQVKPEPLPQCDQCEMHMQVARLFKHWK